MNHLYHRWAFIPILLMTIGMLATHAQTTVTIGTGTVTTYEVPVNLYYENSIVEMVYTASEISAAGWAGGAGVINNIRFNIANYVAFTPMTGSTLSIYVDNWVDTTLNSVPIPGYTGGTLVWTGNHPAFNATGWWNFTLTTPFCWAGGNMYVRVVRSDFDYYSSNNTWNCSYTNVNQCRHDYWDGTTPWNTTMYAMTTRPNIQLVIGAGSAMSYTSSTTTQTNNTPVGSGSVNQEIIGMQVVTSGCSPALSVTSFALSTQGSTSAADIANAKVYYTGGMNAFTPVNQFGSAVVNPSGTFTVTGSQALQAGTNYFWLTYDIAATSTVGNIVDAQCSGITVDGILRTPTVTNPAGARMILSPLSGVYTIDPNGTGSRNFTSFASAVQSMDAAGISGAVTFQVAAGTYTEQITIPEIAGAGATQTITFDGGTGNTATRTITSAINTQYESVITLDGADYLRFRNLTVNSTGSYGYGFLFTNQASNNEISDCSINLPANSSTSSHIGICASSKNGISDYGDWGDNNLIKDNTITGGYYGIRWNGYNNTTNESVGYGNEFIANRIVDFYYYGLYTYYSVGIRIVDNHIYQRRVGTTTTAGYGIYMYYPNLGPEVIRNYVHTNNYPLRIYYPNRNYNSAGITTAVRAKVINNMFIAEQPGTATMYGMYVYYPRYTDVVYNSLFIKTTSGTATVYGFYQYGTSTAYDNITANNMVAYAGDRATYHGIYNNTNTCISFFDHNLFWRYDPLPTNFRWGGTDYTSLAALQAATSTGFHQNSVEGDPYFISDTDLHSRAPVGYQAGTPFAGVSDDFDGDTRSTTTPCIGADEYPAPPPETDLSVSAVMVKTPALKWAHREAPDEHEVVVILENTGLGPDPATVPLTYKIGGVPAHQADGVQQVFTPAWNNRKASVTFSQTIGGLVPGPLAVYVMGYLPDDGDQTNDYAVDNITVENTKIHGAESFDSMLAGTYPFTRDPGWLDLDWSRQNANGGSSLEVMAGMGTSGSQAIGMMRPSEAADEWLVSPGAELLAGSSYRISFDFANPGGAPVTIEAAFGDSPDPAQMTVFATFADIGPGGFLTAKQLAGGMDPYFNTPNLNTMYYLAFRFTTDGSNAQFVIDNIRLEDNPSPPPKIAIGLPGEDVSTYIDNPDHVITIVSNYKQPGQIVRSYEVQSSTNIYGTNGDFLWDVETQTPWITLTKETPAPTAQGYNLVPSRPRQHQTFTMTVNPTGLAPGVHHGEITLYGILFNDDFPPPANGLVATNEPLTIGIELRVVNAGSKNGPVYIEASATLPMTVAGSPYDFTDPRTGDAIATVHVTSGQIDAMTIRAYPNQLPQNITRLLYVKRYWQIMHSGAGWTADITFSYSDQEAAMVYDRSQLRSVRQAVPFGPWEDPTTGTSSASDPLGNMVRVHDFTPANIGGNLALAHPFVILAKDGAGTPETFGLGQNYPNPFNPTTMISFSVAGERHVRVAVYNNLGMEVAELVSDMLPAGRYKVRFDASDLPSGTYLYRLTAGDVVQTQRMTLSK